MAIRAWSLLICAAACVVDSGCNGISTHVENQPPPVHAAVSIAFNPAPPTSIFANTSPSVTAVVTNDPGGQGVDWVVTCSASSCGNLNPVHTASGEPTTYTPPSLSGNSQSVNIQAYAAADHDQNVVAPLTITAFADNLQGTYILQATGQDNGAGGVPPGQTWEFVGAITLDGNGVITGGEQIVGFVDQNLDDGLGGMTSRFVSRPYKISGGSYTLGPDGQGTINIPINDPDLTFVSPDGIETFNFVFLSRSQALISAPMFGQGTMDLQTSMPDPSGAYAFVLYGTDLANVTDVDPQTAIGATAFGGILNIDNSDPTLCPDANAPFSISGQGSIADQNVFSVNDMQIKLNLGTPKNVKGCVSKPDPYGAVTLSLTFDFPTVHPMPAPQATAEITGFVVDSTRMKLIETDAGPDGTGNGFASAGGLAVRQATTPQSQLSAGSYVFSVLGSDGAQFPDSRAPDTSGVMVSPPFPDSMTSVGAFTVDDKGLVTTGYTDTLFDLNCTPACQNGFTSEGAQISAAFAGHFIMDQEGTGRVQLTPANVTPNLTPRFAHHLFIFYLTGQNFANQNAENQSPAALVLDAGDLLDNSGQLQYPSIGTGIAYQQQPPDPQSTTSFTPGRYGFSSAQNVPGIGETDTTGQFQLTPGPNSNSLTLCGRSSGNLTSRVPCPVTGSITLPGSGGRFAGQGLGLGRLDFYPIDPNRGFFVETDLTGPLGTMNVGEGYYATRQPVCDGCP